MRKCHRGGCQNSGKIGVRDSANSVLLLCSECFDVLTRCGIIDHRSGKVLAN